jgi:hypothetical protein
VMSTNRVCQRSVRVHRPVTGFWPTVGSPSGSRRSPARRPGAAGPRLAQHGQAVGDHGPVSDRPGHPVHGRDIGDRVVVVAHAAGHLSPAPAREGSVRRDLLDRLGERPLEHAASRQSSRRLCRNSRIPFCPHAMFLGPVVPLLDRGRDHPAGRVRRSRLLCRLRRLQGRRGSKIDPSGSTGAGC